MDDCPDDLTFHPQRLRKSKCPRQRDFNLLSIKYCGEIFSGRNGPELSEKLEEKITSLKNTGRELVLSISFYDKENSSTFILTIVTPFMIRVHKMVS